MGCHSSGNDKDEGAVGKQMMMITFSRGTDAGESFRTSASSLWGVPLMARDGRDAIEETRRWRRMA